MRHLYAPINFTVKQETTTTTKEQKKMHGNDSTIREIKQKTAVAADAAFVFVVVVGDVFMCCNR